MIIFVAIIAAAALLTLSITTGTTEYGYVALLAALCSALATAAAIWHDRGRGDSITAVARNAEQDGEEPDNQADIDDSTRRNDVETTDEAAVQAEQGTHAAVDGTAEGLPIVHVVPGRKRFHTAGCRALAGRRTDEVTKEEAEEEGFTPCSTCCSRERRRTEPSLS